MLVLHANWTDGTLRVWGESQEAYRNSPRFQQSERGRTQTHAPSASAVAVVTEWVTGGAPTHPFAASSEALHAALATLQIAELPLATASSLRLRLPADDAGPWPSDRLARRTGTVDSPVDPELREFIAAALSWQPEAVLPALAALDQSGPSVAIEFSQSLRYWIAVAGFIVDLLEHQRFVPTISRAAGNGLSAAWQPWLDDADARMRLGQLVRAMPPAARAAVDRHQHQPLAILDEALRTLTDRAIRNALTREQFIDAITNRDGADDAHVAWLSGLLDWNDRVAASFNGAAGTLVQEAGEWIKRLIDRGQNRPLRLCLRLNEPPPSHDPEPTWTLSFHLQSPDHPQQLIDASHIWNRTAASAMPETNLGDKQEILLTELGRASRVYSEIETALEESHPTHLKLTTMQAYEFLRTVRPVLEESGVAVMVPEWWDQPLGRLAMRLHIDAPAAESINAGAGSAPAASMLGLHSIVKFRWQVAIGDQALSAEEFGALASRAGEAPLVQVRGQWVEISPEQLAEAREFLDRRAAGEMTLLEAIQIAHGAAGRESRIAVQGMDATGWVADFLKGTSPDAGAAMPLVDQPREFKGSLRPYQVTGLSWLAFLDRFGLGACLADDMGLGKTIQLIALMLHEREKSTSRNGDEKSTSRQVDKSTDGATDQEKSTSRKVETSTDGLVAADQPDVDFSTFRLVDLSPGPTLLVVPTSVIANWVRELQRFAPSLKAHVQHGPDRPVGDRFAEIARTHDLVITTYPLISRDIESLRRVRWHRVALDEAQYIKNPPTKQTTAIRSLHAPHRLALTGTPVENRLSELWSIMEFLNPGYLGASGEFRRRFGIPIERHHNRLQADRLRQMVRPFVLRRVKTDPKVINDLPDCTETKEYATLTVEQAALYQETVNAMLNQVDRAEGMQRRGLVLATLVKLKQICNHPAQSRPGTAAPNLNASADDEQSPDRPIAPSPNHLSSRSGKARRLMVMLEEVIASGEKALVFTQFRQMGHLLTTMIQHDLDCEALFLHGGTPANKRQHLIDRFQSDDGGVPIFVLSLKAGGLGLNLTAANHVFHYDRWWNPAVENQATDRAFRIGQMRAVQVHKFVCLGTLEERIDQMIEQKTDLAQNIIGAGEQWLTELTTGQLHDLLILRPSALEGES